MKRTLTLAALILAGVAAAPLPSLAASNVSLYIGSAPPAPVYERIPAPRHGYVWAPGYWNWNGHRYVWQKGHFEKVRKGYSYHRPEWRQGSNGWTLDRGGWQRGDRDGDGVRNRFDDHPNNPHRSKFLSHKTKSQSA